MDSKQLELSKNQPIRESFSDFTKDELIAVIQCVKRLEGIFKKEFDIDLYLTWGTLLGAVRENDFIPFDTDIDIAYLTLQKTDFEIVEEHEFIVRTLRDIGLPVQRNSKGQIHVQVQPENRSFKHSIFNLDLWTTWVRDDKYYHYPDIKGEICSNEVLPLVRHSFRGESFWIPSGYDNVLTKFYGTDWHIPNPDYGWYPRYDVSDEFEFLRSSSSDISIPKFPQRAIGLRIEEQNNFYFISGNSLREEKQRLNPTAMLILELCNGKNNVENIILFLQESYKLPSAPEVVVLEFLSNALRCGLINLD